MTNPENGMPLPDLDADKDIELTDADTSQATLAPDDDAKNAATLEAVFDVPVHVSAVLGRSRMDVGELLKLGPGAVLELDRKVGEAIDIYVNDRLVARGEVVLVEDKLGVTMTEIIKTER
jgi:flagellar motor switch protein FliN